MSSDPWELTFRTVTEGQKYILHVYSNLRTMVETETSNTAHRDFWNLAVTNQKPETRESSHTPNQISKSRWKVQMAAGNDVWELSQLLIVDNSNNKKPEDVFKEVKNSKPVQNNPPDWHWLADSSATSVTVTWVYRYQSPYHNSDATNSRQRSWNFKLQHPEAHRTPVPTPASESQGETRNHRNQTMAGDSRYNESLTQMGSRTQADALAEDFTNWLGSLEAQVNNLILVDLPNSIKDKKRHEAQISRLDNDLSELRQDLHSEKDDNSKKFDDLNQRLRVIESEVDALRSPPMKGLDSLLQDMKTLLLYELNGSATIAPTRQAGPAAHFDQLLDALRDSTLANSSEYIKKLKPEGLYSAESAHAHPDTLRGLLVALLRQEDQARPAEIDWNAKYPILHELSGEVVKRTGNNPHQAVSQALEELLGSLDIKMIHPRPGEQFDRTYHRSLGREPAPHLDRGQIASVDRPGFLKGGNTLLLAYVRTG